MVDSESALAQIKRGCEALLVEDEFIARLKTGKPLKVKFGVDPTAPDIHLGHTVVLNKLKILQDLGHHIVFLIGDFTARIGDPTGKNTTRPPLSEADITHNIKSYQEQAFKVLDPAKTEVRYNSEWLDKLSSMEMISLAAKSTVARMLERDDFSKRYKGGQPIAIHEFIYPLVQGYDSVALEADLELGGTDQTFNLLMGRELQKEAGQKPQCILTMPLLVGTDGVKKMSKSAHNYIGITEHPDEMFGKIMSISDELMWRYFELLSFLPMGDIAAFEAEVKAGANPRDYKVKLAREIIARFHGDAAATSAYESFVARFQKNQIPDEMPEVSLSIKGENLPIANVLHQAKLVTSTSDGMRMVKQGGVKQDGEKIADHKAVIAPGTYIFQVGKRRFARITIG
jgi:tyrosyl-tRNA synthetase